MFHYNNKMVVMNYKEVYIFIQNYCLKQGIKNFVDQGKKAPIKEKEQPNNRVVFEPIDVNDLTKDGRKRVMESLIFLTKKCEG